MWNKTDGPQDYAKVVGANVRRLREREGWTLKQLESVLTERGYPIGFRVLSKIETGGATVRVNDLVALASALDVDVERLLLPSAVVLNEELVAMAAYLGELADDQRKAQRTYFQGMREVIARIEELSDEEPEAAASFLEVLRGRFGAGDEQGFVHEGDGFAHTALARSFESHLEASRKPPFTTADLERVKALQAQQERVIAFLEDRYGQRPEDDLDAMTEWADRVIKGESNRG